MSDYMPGSVVDVNERAIELVKANVETLHDSTPDAIATAVVLDLARAGMLVEPPLIDAEIVDVAREGRRSACLTVSVDDVVEQQFTAAISVGIAAAMRKHRNAFVRANERAQNAVIEEIAADARGAAIKFFYEGKSK
jgi:hypothetical protein